MLARHNAGSAGLTGAERRLLCEVYVW
jgi:hypothetical protein